MWLSIEYRYMSICQTMQFAICYDIEGDIQPALISSHLVFILYSLAAKYCSCLPSSKGRFGPQSSPYTYGYLEKRSSCPSRSRRSRGPPNAFLCTLVQKFRIW